MMRIFTFIVLSALFNLSVAFSGKFRPNRFSTALDASILDTAKSTGYFNTVLTAINACGLAPALSGEGPLTVFLPSDEAFAKLPPGTVDSLLKDIPKLTEILKFHVHPGKMNPTRTGRTMDTLLVGGDGYPKQLTVKCTNWTCISFIFGGNETPAQVMGTGDGSDGANGKPPPFKYEGIKCDNGAIHELNQVLMPYEGDLPPKITFIGFGGITEKPRLQLDYYGSEAGKGRNKVGTDKVDLKAYENISGAWKEGCNYLQKPEKGVERLG